MQTAEAPEDLQKVVTTSETLLEEVGGAISKLETLVNASEEVSGNVSAAASSVEELSASINEITGQTDRGADASRAVIDRVENATESVSTLQRSIAEIGRVLQLIKDIAAQTNLLALNATIEAARAGDAGKGFAVVAAEVKSLATETGKATEDIAKQIEEIEAKTQRSVDAVSGIRELAATTNEVSSAIAAALNEQSAATQEISRSLERAASGSRDYLRAAEDIRAGAEADRRRAQAVHDAACAAIKS